MRVFKAEASRQSDFTNSFVRQLAVILVAIVLINWLGPIIIPLTQKAGGGDREMLLNETASSEASVVDASY